MTPLGPLALILLSALLHAGWNALVKRCPDARTATVGVLAVATVAAAAAALLGDAPAFATGRALALALAAGVFEGAYFATLGAALARSPLGVAYTIARGGAIVLVWPLSAALFSEAVTPLGASGAAVILGGLVLCALPALLGGARGGARGGVGFAVLCAASIAGYHLCYKAALAAGARPSPLFALSLAVALPPNLVLLGAERRRALVALFRTRAALVVLAGLVCTASFVVFLGALGGAGAGAVLTLRNTSVLFAQGFSILIGERPRRVEVIGAALVAVGAALLGWPR